MGKRGPKPKPAEERTFKVLVCFKLEVKKQILDTIQRWQLKQKLKDRRKPRDLTISEFVREAVWEKCKLPDDPRQP